MSSSGSDNAIRIPVEIVLDQTTRQLATLRRTAETEGAAAARSVQTSMGQVEQAAVRGVQSMGRETASLRETFRGTSQAVAGMQQGLILLGTRGPPAIGALTTALAGLLAQGLNPVAIAIAGTTGLLAMFSQVSEEAERVTSTIGGAAKATDTLAAAIDRLTAAQRGRIAATTGPSVEEQELLSQIGANEAEMARIRTREAGLPSISGLSDMPNTPVSRRLAFLESENLRLRQAIETLRQAVVIEQGTSALTGAPRTGASGGGALAAEIARLGREGDWATAGMIARESELRQRTIARLAEFDQQFAISPDEFFGTPGFPAPGDARDFFATLGRRPGSEGPVPSLWTAGPTPTMSSALFGTDMERAVAPDSAFSKSIQTSSKDALVAGLTEGFSNPENWQGALSLMLGALQRGIANAVAGSIVGDFGGSGLLGLASSVGASAASSALGAGGATPPPEGFFDDVFPQKRSFKSGEQSIVVINVADEATADNILSKASGAGARAVVVKGNGGGVSRGSLSPRRRR